MNQQDDLRKKYRQIQTNHNLTKIDKKVAVRKLYTTSPLYVRPPKDANYDNYGSNKVARLQMNGLYPEIKLALGERPVGDPNQFAKALSDLDAVCIADLRINQFEERTNEIARAINRICHTTGNLILIGDVLHPKVQTSYALLLHFLNVVKTRNIYLILGKHDIFTVNDYMSFGFSYVTDRAEKTIDGNKVIFTYFPVPLKRNQFNIHGSLLGSGRYPHMSRENHFDANIRSDSERLDILTIGDILDELRGDEDGQSV